MHNNIMRKKLVLPRWLAPTAHSFHKALLTREPTKRLGHLGGAAEVRAHAFFAGLDWAKLFARELEAPLRSRAHSDDPLDTSAHAERYTKTLPALSPLTSPAILSTSQQQLFWNFDWAADSESAPGSSTGDGVSLHAALPPPAALLDPAALSHRSLSLNAVGPSPVCAHPVAAGRPPSQFDQSKTPSVDEDPEAVKPSAGPAPAPDKHSTALALAGKAGGKIPRGTAGGVVG